MTRQFLVFMIALGALAGSLVAAGTTADARDKLLRGYVDATQDSALPYRIPRLGVNAELSQYTASQLDVQLDLMQIAHVTWVRQNFLWDEIESEAGQYEWERSDRIVESVAAHPDLGLVAVIVNTPQWARPQGADDHTTPSAD